MSGRVPLIENPPYLGIEWDAENRLLAINQGILRSEFSYDGQDRRVRIVEKQSGSVITDKRFLWCRGTICEERSPDGATISRRFFAQGMQESSASFLYTHDRLGSIREMTDSNASALTRARYEYEAFGERSLVGGDKSTPFGFTGHYMHEVSGLAMARFRVYDSRLARWLSEDPLDLDDGPNKYAYSHNAPVNRVDPDGLEGVPVSPSGRRPNNSELLACADVGRFWCGVVYGCRLAAEMAVRERFRIPDGATVPDNTRPNAMLHCIWSCCMAQTGGPDFSRRFGDAHENFPLNDICQKEMDQNNNDLGTTAGAANRGMSCKDICEGLPLQRRPKQKCSASPYCSSP
jgi:RHS repeat-associated protein